jgi:DNA helicase HerA-like ATPase
MAIDEAHQFVPTGKSSLAKEYLIRWVKEGRQPGLSLIAVSQQPSAIDGEVLSQCDIILSHKLTTKEDIDSLNKLSQDYMSQELKAYIQKLSRTGEAVLVDDEAEKVLMISVRPRRSHHGGGEIR